MNYICNDLQVNIPIGEVGNDSRIFLWDNLASHCAPMIHQTVEGQWGHLIIRRPPYMPADGPIEYIFCQLIVELQSRTFFMNSVVELVHEIQNVVTNLHGFDATFNKIGY